MTKILMRSRKRPPLLPLSPEQTVPEFPELTCENFRNPQKYLSLKRGKVLSASDTYLKT